MLGRREFLGTVGAAAVALTAARSLLRTAPGTKASVARASTPADLLAQAGVAPSARFGGCQVTAVQPAKDGALTVRMADRAGTAFEVEVLAFDAQAPGVARAGSLGVYMKNRGSGKTATVEEHGLAAMAMAHQMAQREASGLRLPSLPSLRQRTAQGVA